MKFKRHQSVEGMLAHTLPGNSAVIRGVRKQAGINTLSNSLFIIRTACGVSQAEMAKRLGVSQSAVSKMENRGDALLFNDAMRYLTALDCTVDIGFVQHGGIKDRLDYHAGRINDILTELSTLAGDDPDINVGTLEAFKKVLEAIVVNFIPPFAKKLEKLAKGGVKVPMQINIAHQPSKAEFSEHMKKTEEQIARGCRRTKGDIRLPV